ncbi:MAG TPA: hypothetical protein VJ873_05420, partial [bacterium]|nr:hypothetical protein [bacterium]
GNVAFMVLMSALILRPVVIQVTSGSRLADASATRLSALSHHGEMSFPSAFRVSKSQKWSSLKVIPKEIAGFEGLAPRFAEFSLPLPSHFQSSAVPQWGGFPASNPLYLRI